MRQAPGIRYSYDGNGTAQVVVSGPAESIDFKGEADMAKKAEKNGEEGFVDETTKEILTLTDARKALERALDIVVLHEEETSDGTVGKILFKETKKRILEADDIVGELGGKR